mgnify:CR=1 FL=1
MENILKRIDIERKIYDFTFFDLVFIYIIGGTIGSIYETVFYYIVEGTITNHSGSVLFFVNGTYGLGIALLTLVLYHVKNWFMIFILGSVFTGFTEYMVSLFDEKILRISTWNYSHLPLNINGRTTILISLGWGLLGLLIILFFIPKVLKYLHKIPKKPYNVLSIIFLTLIIIDVSVSFVAVYRYSGRHFNIYYQNKFFEIVDSVFNDKYMQERFPNLTFV